MCSFCQDRLIGLFQWEEHFVCCHESYVVGINVLLRVCVWEVSSVHIEENWGEDGSLGYAVFKESQPAFVVDPLLSSSLVTHFLVSILILLYC